MGGEVLARFGWVEEVLGRGTGRSVGAESRQGLGALHQLAWRNRTCHC